MAYNGDMQWSDLTGLAEFNAKMLKDALINGAEGRQEWNNFKNGRTHLAIATQLGVSEGDIDAIDALYTAMLDLYQCANNQSVAQADRLSIMRMFT